MQNCKTRCKVPTRPFMSADRVGNLARRAVSKESQLAGMSEVIIMRFCLGCRDRVAGVKAYEKGPPTTLDDAIRTREHRRGLTGLPEQVKLALSHKLMRLIGQTDKVCG
ncbi:hypothetical protein PoB_004394400 [Plakobranchus ocellatus]|uniref:Uncharacterized protein n=1 Tax=Plakobranchus ocellatus TaxID=259542 RepID=A0AAV4BF35_9GAST|nr:hypothetical protein PoB_004394400 [Plakobranchus ocellatus]